MTNAGMLIVEESSVILPVEMGNDPEGYPLVKHWRTVALSNMVQFSDVDEAVPGKRPKKRG